MNTQKWIDTLALFAVCIILTVAFIYQLFLGELPCALCNLQRIGFMIFGAGLLLNLWSGFNSANYVLSAGGALIGSLVALLQMFVHVLPGTPPTGSTFLGLHMYALSYLMLTCAVGYCVVMLSVRTRQKPAYQSSPAEKRSMPAKKHAMPTVVVATLFSILTAANLVSAFLENGFHPFLVGGQQHYEMLYNGDLMKR